ncbi:hypothetical protein ORV05_08520 [Amycolatopsis cynarae]|uniref:Ankyrin repeat domain-containing protein n=1 Tax=Amycolatopsis cynarae TaxID=2995223 RepID=A0ABY7B636_9PSEU|nr:hypothetical protein [Amycolatopsis sp. HUAS 11-8]WAL67802.1 hypothetical protein ORV05_08520 [Amycolatopsis sp. HUAS 11-8]
MSSVFSLIPGDILNTPSSRAEAARIGNQQLGKGKMVQACCHLGETAEFIIVDAIQQLGYAAETGDVERVARLLREGVPVDAGNTVGRPRTALDRAIWAEQTG